MFNNKGISSVAITLIIAVLILGGAFVYFSQNQTVAPTEDSNVMVDKSSEDGVMEKDGEDAMMKDSGGTTEKKDEIMSQIGSYENYDATKVSMAARDGKAILFFHANWCPTCRALNSNIESNLSKIPSGVTIFKTDYDTQIALKQKYGITYQHTLVQVDASGNQLAKWSGSPTLTDLVSKIK